jgi:tRNA (adenine57-N1/adenine58-N1)-methyltransferase
VPGQIITIKIIMAATVMEGVEQHQAPALSLLTISPFFHTPPTAEADSLAIFHVKRDSLLPITLRTTADDGYAEGAVTNTRFGSYPHSTIIGVPWGSQVRASKVDTGTRGRKGKQAKATTSAPAQDDVQEQTQDGIAEDSRKRKADDQEPEPAVSPTKKMKRQPEAVSKASQTPQAAPHKVAIEAGSGFMHVLQPTPESWTYSLDHRTQVVYTPDYSYILQRMQVKPGDTLIEAGAGSGSFTHAAARAIFNGYPSDPSNTNSNGKVCSFEYHEPRVDTLRDELTSHGLTNIVHVNHRDVYNEGFLLPNSVSPRATAIFLDLPAPWLALKHLTREDPSTPLNPDSAVQICTFSPCIEQVTATVSAMRKAGWTEIQMVEVQNRRLDVRRERIGLKEEGLRGVNSSAATVEESLCRLREVDAKLNEFHAGDGKGRVQSKAERLAEIKKGLADRKLYKEGRLVHRTEPEVKTHTSYLTFAVLPKAWSEQDEAKAAEEWPVDMTAPGGKVKARP